MSIHVMSLVWEIEFPTQAQKLIALRLADYANDEGDSIFPAVETLSRHVGCSKRNVQYALKAFEHIGLMVQLHEGGHGPGDTNQWKMNVDLIVDLALGNSKLNGKFDAIEVVDNKGAGFAPLTLRRVQSALIRVQPTSLKGAAHCTQPFTNHQLEPSTREGAREVGNFDLGKSEVKSAAASHPKTSFQIFANDPQWPAWIDHLLKLGLDDLMTDATTAGEMLVYGSRWPRDDSPAPSVKRSKLTETSKRITGEAVE